MRYLVFLFIFALAGCAQLSGSSSGEAPQDDNEPGKEAAVSGNNRFAFGFYQELKAGHNIFFSPYSISSALAMTYTGSAGETRREMAEVFGFLSGSRQNALAYHQLQQHLDSFNQEDLALNVANSLWGQKDFAFQPRFLDINGKYFSAGIKRVDFKRQHRQVRQEINRWVEQKTNDRIQDLLSEGVLDRMTRLVLVNAIYFNGQWENPFNKDHTRPDVFYKEQDKTLEVPFMNQSLRLPYYENDLLQMISIPYDGGDLSMVILLPRKIDDMARLEENLDAKWFDRHTDSLQKQQVGLSMPRFELTLKYRLNDHLKRLGMPSAFGGKADFSGMTGRKDLYISEAIHQAFVKVNETGTEAAAATGVVMRKTAIVRKKSFKADHPFLFMIRDNATNAILFMGKITDPS